MRNDLYGTGEPEVVACGTTTRRTRVARTCDTCGEAIPAGTKYDRRALKVDGDMRASAHHLGH